MKSLTISSLLLFSHATALSSQYGKTTRNIATQVLQGTGPVAVDMNQYNLPLGQIEKEWTASFVQKVDENQKKVYLDTKNDKENFVDTVEVMFPRLENAGLGIELS